MICGKTIYESRTAAAKMQSGVKDRDVSCAYFCNDCKGWHVASQEVKSKNGFKGQTVDTKFDHRPNQKRIEQSLTEGTVVIHNNRTFEVK